MMRLELRLQYAERPIRTAAAWFLPGGSARGWLDELASWPGPQAALKLYPLPRSAHDLEPGGVLVVGGDGPRSASGSLVLPYGCLAGRLYLPVEGRLVPEVSESELAQRLVGHDDVYVWHPTAGLVRFESNEGLRLGDLWRPVPRRMADWSLGQPGVRFNTRLVSLQADELPTVESVFGQGREDIGADADEIRRRLESPQGPLATLGGLAALPLMPVAGLIQWLGKMLPASPGGAKAFGQLGDWAAKIMGGASSFLEAARQKELQRLLSLLDANPDEGLRYALPLGGTGGSQLGTAAPTSRLARHDVDFHLGGLDVGGLFDLWDAPSEIVQRLHERYRQLANREMRLGRYRRAAYIFAALLGELEAAAGALMAGGHWREAAVLYRDRLKQPLEAARCLEKGGLFHEAIALYETSERFEQAGDVHARLGDADSAQHAYRRAVVHLRNQRDYLESARVLQHKLDEVDEALGILDDGWCQSNQARMCLERSFQILGELGRHEASAAMIDRLKREVLSSRAGCLADILSLVSVNYPDRSVRAVAADAVCVLAGTHLPSVSRTDAQQYLQAVKRAASADRLLARDCDRYLREHGKHLWPKPDRRRKPQAVTLVREIALPDNVHWIEAAGTSDTYYVAGYRNNFLHVIRAYWDDEKIEPHYATWNCSVVPDSRILMAADSRDLHPLLIYVAGLLPLSDRAFPPSKREPPALPAGSPPWIPQLPLALARAPHGMSWVLSCMNGAFVLNGYNRNDEPISTCMIEMAEPASQDVEAPIVYSTLNRILLHGGNSYLYLALGDRMYRIAPGGLVESYELLGHFTLSLCGSAHSTRERIAVTHNRGGTLFWVDYTSHMEPFATNLEDPLAAFTGSGWLIAVGEEGGQIYDTQSDRIRFHADFSLERSLQDTESRPLAVLPARTADQFAIITDTRVRIYQVNSR